MTKDMNREQMEALLGGNIPEMPVETEKKDNKPVSNASDAQMKYYRDLCAQKNVTPEEKTFTSVEINAEIQRLKTLPYWKECSQNQIDRITELCTMLNIQLPDFSKLNGAYGQSASIMIQRLKEMSKNVVLPISEKQLAMVLQMNYCPDCEVVDEPEKMTQKEASEYIAKFKDAFYGWKKTRLSPEQAKLIETLTERLGSKLPYSAIIQFDEGTAHKYIEQLEAELADKSLVETTLEPEEMYGIATKDKEDARNELRNLVAKLYASIGQQLEDDFFETMSWTSLKELVDFVKLFGIDVVAMFDRVEIFTEDQKQALLA